MFEQPVEKRFTDSQFYVGPTADAGTISTLGLDYSRIGNLIHGHLVVLPSTAANHTVRIPIKSYFGISISRSIGGNIAADSITADTDGFLIVAFASASNDPYTVRFMGSDNKTFTAGDPNGSRSLLYPMAGTDYTPPLVKTGGAGTISAVSAVYRVPRSPVKLVTGQFVASGAVNLRFNIGPGAIVYESFFSQADASNVAAGVPGAGGVAFVIPGAGTFVFAVLFRERG